jgi:hypothetical protein
MRAFGNSIGSVEGLTLLGIGLGDAYMGNTSGNINGRTRLFP